MWTSLGFHDDNINMPHLRGCSMDLEKLTKSPWHWPQCRCWLKFLVKVSKRLHLLDFWMEVITKTYLYMYNFDSLKLHFYKTGFTGVYIIFLISAQKHRLWVLVRTEAVLTEAVLTEAVLTSIHNLCFEQKYEKYQNFYLKIFSFWW